MRIGLLGAASVTPFAIIRPAKAIPAITLAGVAARDRLRAAAYAEEHSIEKAYDTYDELIAADDIDLIYIGLPINLHAEWCVKAANAGKHVLCEKPFAMNLTDAEKAVAAGERAGVRVIEAFHNLYHPAFFTLQNWLNEGAIGRVKEIETITQYPVADDGRTITHRPETGGGAMMDNGCYGLSFALSLLNAEPSSITASADLTPSGVDDRMTAELKFDGGVTTKLIAAMPADEPAQSSLTITGETGSISFFDDPLIPHKGARLILKNKDGEHRAPIDRISTYAYQLAAVAEAIDYGTPLPSEGATLLRQQRVLDATYAAAGLAHLRDV